MDKITRIERNFRNAMNATAQPAQAVSMVQGSAKTTNRGNAMATKADNWI